MIARMILHNFQSHRHTEISFVDGLNVIVGSSDSGKSAIIRGLRWVAENLPSGDSFIRHGEEECYVTLILDDGTEVTRYRKGTKNLYTIDDDKYEAFGKGVPEDVREVLNLKPVNWQQQHDSPFLLSETATSIARTLNEVTNLSIIDGVLTEAGRASREIRAQVKSATAGLEETKERFDALSYTEEMEEALAKVEVLIRDHQVQASSAALLGRTIEATETLQANVGRLTASIPEEKVVARLAKQVALLAKLSHEAECLDEIITEVTELNMTLEFESSLNALKERLQTVLELMQRAGQYAEKIEILDGRVRLFESLTRSIKAKEAELAEIKIENCPACGRPINGDTP